MSTFEHKFVVAAALCVLLAGCGGGPGQMYYASSAVPAQTADAAYWDCAGQAWAMPNASWIPLPATQGMGGTMASVNYCMYQKGWTPKPHLELTTGTWVAYQPPR